MERHTDPLVTVDAAVGDSLPAPDPLPDSDPVLPGEDFIAPKAYNPLSLAWEFILAGARADIREGKVIVQDPGNLTRAGVQAILDNHLDRPNAFQRLSALDPEKVRTMSDPAALADVLADMVCWCLNARDSAGRLM